MHIKDNILCADHLVERMPSTSAQEDQLQEALGRVIQLEDQLDAEGKSKAALARDKVRHLSS